MMTISVLPVKTDLKAQVLAVINEHQGWENAIKRDYPENNDEPVLFTVIGNIYENPDKMQEVL